MVVLTKGELEQITLPAVQRTAPPLAFVPEVDLSAAGDNAAARSAAARAVAKACEDHGFFKVTGHGVPAPLLARLDAAAAAFFALPQRDKDKAAAAVGAGGGSAPFGYASKRIGGNGDLGWVEYLLLGVTAAGAAAAPVALSAAPVAASEGAESSCFR
jgi:gibberellin 2-oxidase